MVSNTSVARVTVYSTATCPICDRAKNLLTKWGIAYNEVRVDSDKQGLQAMATITNGARTVPQIVIDGKLVGGFSELTEWHMDNKLDQLIDPV